MAPFLGWCVQWTQYVSRLRRQTNERSSCVAIYVGEPCIMYSCIHSDNILDLGPQPRVVCRIPSRSSRELRPTALQPYTNDTAMLFGLLPIHSHTYQPKRGQVCVWHLRSDCKSTQTHSAFRCIWQQAETRTWRSTKRSKVVSSVL